MGKLTSTIGIPIKLLNEAQVRYIPRYCYLDCYTIHVHIARKWNSCTISREAEGLISFSNRAMS